MLSTLLAPLIPVCSFMTLSQQLNTQYLWMLAQERVNTEALLVQVCIYNGNSLQLLFMH